MRIISGTLKSRSLKYLRNSSTRPLKDNVRESIFNVLEHSNLIQANIKKSKILDLYSGIGSFGIESISRGAAEVTFIEKDEKASDILKENLIKLGIINKSKIYIKNIEDVLINNFKGKFHIFFLDPPFADFNFLRNLEIIKKKKFFNKEHIVIIHREEKCEDQFVDILEVIEIKQYGRSKIIFGVFN